MTSPLANIYARLPVAFSHGQGVWLWDANGRKYLDALAGIGVSCLGHAHPKLVAAISEQAARVIHTSNIYDIPQQEALAARLTALSGMREVAFCNSGSEANEAAIKLARYYAYQRGNQHAHIITMDSSWHGRTLATLAATGSEKARKGFEPLPTGFIQVPYNDLAAVRAAGDAEPRTTAVLLEVLQGEGGIRPSDMTYLQALRQLCTERGWLLMIDEVQSGIGRTGKWFAHQWADIKPDVMTLAKGLAGGVPIGAMLAAGPAAGVFTPGSHGTTFGGGPLVCAAGLAVLDTLETDKLLDNAHTVGAYLQDALASALTGTVGVTEVRGRGLMLGIELARPCGVLALRAMEAGLLINVTRDRVVRLLPPLILNKQEADQIVAILVPLIQDFLAEHSSSLSRPGVAPGRAQ
ncbi:aspartate aminotransferase family protein [Achromobacter spanius]|uniref:Acetylornithine aminotransferase n=1 Tax=Achromobacter spanius TaxID=217203 RepID=A0AAW3I6R9_9BURK|nr:aspartate aminotransferase family protein [Achromobacter spanius]KNE28459.1 acetylornithine aminotransferase [Achromobacter spanius]